MSDIASETCLEERDGRVEYLGDTFKDTSVFICLGA